MFVRTKIFSLYKKLVLGIVAHAKKEIHVRKKRNDEVQRKLYQELRQYTKKNLVVTTLNRKTGSRKKPSM